MTVDRATMNRCGLRIFQLQNMATGKIAEISMKYYTNYLIVMMKCVKMRGPSFVNFYML